MRNNQTRLPIILILIVLLSAAHWSVAGASTRSSALLPSSRPGLRHVSLLSGEPDTPAVRGPSLPGASGGNARLVYGGFRATTAGIWLRMLEIRLLGQ